MKHMFIVPLTMLQCVALAYLLTEGALAAVFISVVLTLIAYLIMVAQKQKEIESLKNQAHWQKRLLELTHEANPQALRAGLGLEVDELMKLFASQEMQQHYAHPDDTVAAEAATVRKNQIKSQKNHLNELVKTAIDAGLILPAGWTYQDLASKQRR